MCVNVHGKLFPLKRLAMSVIQGMLGSANHVCARALVHTCPVVQSAANKRKTTGLAGQMGMTEAGRAIHVDCQVEVAPEPSAPLLLSLGHYYLPRLP